MTRKIIQSPTPLFQLRSPQGRTPDAHRDDVRKMLRDFLRTNSAAEERS